MSIFNVFKRADIGEGLERFRATPNGVLLDVRTHEEYSTGHIPDSVNLDLQEIKKAPTQLPDKTAPIFVYCHSGMRSGQAVFMLNKMGYQNVENIGGIMEYRGEIVR